LSRTCTLIGAVRRLSRDARARIVVCCRGRLGAARDGAWGRRYDHRTGPRGRSPDDSARDAADRRAHGPADDSACNGSASRAGQGAVAVSDSQVGSAARARVESPMIVARMILLLVERM
jgi:hypothetical protein